MNKKFPIALRLLLVAIVCGVMTSGCWSAHPHSGYRTIHQCAINGDAAGVAAELTKFPDELNLPEDGGVTPLHLAAENCHTNVVMLLLEKGADMNIMADDKATPLHLASQQGCADVVAMLLAKGADINARDNQGHTPLARAKLWHQDAIVQLLQAHGGLE